MRGIRLAFLFGCMSSSSFAHGYWDIPKQFLDKPIYAAFQTYCVETSAEPDAMEAALYKAGATRTFSPQKKIGSAEVTTTTWTIQRGDVVVHVSRVKTQYLAFRASQTCIISSPSMDMNSINAILKWVGVAPSQVVGHRWTFAYDEIGNARTRQTINATKLQHNSVNHLTHWNLVVQAGDGVEIELTKSP